jgi:hypothetical protein
MFESNEMNNEFAQYKIYASSDLLKLLEEGGCLSTDSSG